MIISQKKRWISSHTYWNWWWFFRFFGGKVDNAMFFRYVFLSHDIFLLSRPGFAFLAVPHISKQKLIGETAVGRHYFGWAGYPSLTRSRPRGCLPCWIRWVWHAECSCAFPIAAWCDAWAVLAAHGKVCASPRTCGDELQVSTWSWVCRTPRKFSWKLCPAAEQNESPLLWWWHCCSVNRKDISNKHVDYVLLLLHHRMPLQLVLLNHRMLLLDNHRMLLQQRLRSSES